LSCSNESTQTRIAPKESSMDLLAALPEWLVWCVAGAVAAVALKALARMIEAALDLEAR
jgi:hypothetical protein